jgi:hypothetical protein
MKNRLFSGHFLRRKDNRRRVRFCAIVECHGVSRMIEVIDFSNAGLRVDKLTGLAVGDRLTISLTPDIAVEGTIVWLVWHKAGIQFMPPLTDADPAYRFLMDQAALFEQARVRAISVLAQQETTKTRQSDPG